MCWIIDKATVNEPLTAAFWLPAAFEVNKANSRAENVNNHNLKLRGGNSSKKWAVATGLNQEKLLAANSGSFQNIVELSESLRTYLCDGWRRLEQFEECNFWPRSTFSVIRAAVINVAVVDLSTYTKAWPLQSVICFKIQGKKDQTVMVTAEESAYSSSAIALLVQIHDASWHPGKSVDRTGSGSSNLRLSLAECSTGCKTYMKRREHLPIWTDDTCGQSDQWRFSRNWSA